LAVLLWVNPSAPGSPASRPRRASVPGGSHGPTSPCIEGRSFHTAGTAISLQVGVDAGPMRRDIKGGSGGSLDPFDCDTARASRASARGGNRPPTVTTGRRRAVQAQGLSRPGSCVRTNGTSPVGRCSASAWGRRRIAHDRDCARCVRQNLAGD